MDNVILVGFMGAGKSSVGRLVARRLGRCFVETDDMITAREGRPIPEIFADRGEAHFRALEEEALALLAEKRGDVIATGGGFPCREGRPEALRALGTVVWLACDFDDLRRARAAGERPMLAGRTPTGRGGAPREPPPVLPPGAPDPGHHRPRPRPGGARVCQAVRSRELPGEYSPIR